MGAGARSEPVRLERMTETADGMGGRAEAWVLVTTLWCDVKPLRASEQERLGAVRSLSVYQFTADALSVKAHAVTSSDRIVWQSRTFNVREMRTPKNSVHDIDIIAETGS